MNRFAGTLVPFVSIPIALAPDIAQAGAGDVVACRKITDDHERLACFDRTSAALEKDINSSSEGLFGFLGLGATKEQDFGKSPKLPSGDNKIPEVSSVTAKIIGFAAADGRPVFTLENGQVWKSQDYKHVHLKHDGNDVAVVKRSLLGYLMTINDASYDLSVKRVE